ncbi:carotenoid oxygenase family protein (plasmid) [Streptomyces sp. HUAS 31]|uniref:carotenoid oxygenase family protein n=1 Tax=Streptomyces sp. HUAS 31 TaxID=3020055 RepID=UPI00230575A3|nr:carotenoid oxygenase family protein [Streptomyces sp. HUAS 31]WCE02495.1 carotenoid oxygenase family protein [Streptomyces sp. HUAS 31]
MSSSPQEAMETQDRQYQVGHYEPVPDEINGFDLKVTGTLPPDLDGRYLRNGPNPRPGEDSGHVFTGHGMLHGVRLRGGRAEWYRNRWVRTSRLAGSPSQRADGTPDLTAVTANTHVISHADKLLALVEAGLPYEVTDELETVGPCDFGGRLTTSMTAHPKEDPVTGELLFFGYSPRPPYVTYHRLSAAGELVETQEISVPAGIMMHDLAITENYVIWLDLPLVFDPALFGRNSMPVRWDDAHGARLGLMRRDRAGEVRWFDVEPCYVFHVGNAHEDAAGRVVLDAVRYSRKSFHTMWQMMGGHVDEPLAGGPRMGELQVGNVHRWLLDPATGTVSEQALDDRGVEMPTLNDELTGRRSRYLYTITESAVVKYDTLAGTSQSYDTPPGAAPGEAVFAPARDAAGQEDAGYLLSMVSHGLDQASELLVLDAQDMTRLASVEMPRRVPFGFHGSWVPDRQK